MGEHKDEGGSGKSCLSFPGEKSRGSRPEAIQDRKKQSSRAIYEFRSHSEKLLITERLWVL